MKYINKRGDELVSILIIYFLATWFNQKSFSRNCFPDTHRLKRELLDMLGSALIDASQLQNQFSTDYLFTASPVSG